MRTWLKEIRTNMHKSQADVANKVGISQQCYFFYESGERRPSVEVAKKIGEYLNFDWTRFYT